MNKKNLKIEIARTVSLVSVVFIVGVALTACQSSVSVKKVDLQNSDFAYPTKDPSVADGKKLFSANCAQCHGFENGEKKAHNFSLKFVNSTLPSQLFKTITGDKKHASFKDKLSIKERWDVVMYLRYQLFGLPKDAEDIKTKFGGNCAVCHGTRGFADGNLHYYLNPPPANFNQFERLYERTDEKIFDEIANGIPWTAMPPWAGRHDKDKNFDFNDEFIWELVKHVRAFGYTTEADVLRDEKLFKGEKK